MDVDNLIFVFFVFLMVVFRIYFIINYGCIVRIIVWVNILLDVLVSGYKLFDISWGNDNIIYIW